MELKCYEVNECFNINTFLCEFCKNNLACEDKQVSSNFEPKANYGGLNYHEYWSDEQVNKRIQAMKESGEYDLTQRIGIDDVDL